MTGTRATSGSLPTRFRKRVIVATPSSMPSSTLTSTICAPPSTCCRAMLTPASRSPASTAFENFGLPVTFVRSPTFTKFVFSVTSKASRPLRRSRLGSSGATRGASPRTAPARTRMCSGVVPQHPPTTFSRPSSAKARSTRAMCSGLSSYSPNSFGRPALG